MFTGGGTVGGTVVMAGAGGDLITVGPSRPVRLPEASWGSRQRPAPPTTAMATRLITAMATRPTGACTVDPRTTGPSTTAMRITDRSIIAGPTGGLSTTVGPITGQRTSTGVRITGVRITGVRTGGDKGIWADTIAPGPEASPQLQLGRRAVLDRMPGAVSSIADAQVSRAHELAPREPARFA